MKGGLKFHLLRAEACVNPGDMYKDSLGGRGRKKKIKLLFVIIFLKANLKEIKLY